jgi:hypothetical protein
MNRADKPRDFLLWVNGPKLSAVNVIGLGVVKPPVNVPVEADKVRTLRVLLTVAPHDIRARSEPVTFEITNATGTEKREVDSVFVSGGKP